MEIEAYLVLKLFRGVCSGGRSRGGSTSFRSRCHGVVGLGFLISELWLQKWKRTRQWMN